jgi:hypothetical protein
MNIFFLFLLLPQLVLAGNLYLLEKQGGNCVGKRISLPDKKEEKFLQLLGNCPKKLILHQKSGALTYLGADNEIFLQKLGANKATGLGKLQGLDDFWFDHATGLLMAVALVDLSQKSVKIKSGPVTNTQEYTFEGKVYSSTTLPAWGKPQMAVLYAYEEKQWKRKEIAPTRSEEEETPGLSELRGYALKKISGIEFGNRLKNGTCVSGLNCRSESKLAKKYMGLKKSDPYGEVSVGKNLFLFPVVYGDADYFASGPLFFCNSNTCSKVTNFQSSEFLSIIVAGSFIIVSEEFGGSKATIVDATNGSIVMTFPNSTASYWE